MSGRQASGGVVLAFLGFAGLTMAFKGTWTQTWDALTGKSKGTTRTTLQPTGPGAGAGSNTVYVSSSSTVQATGRPGGAPTPTPLPANGLETSGSA